MEKFLVNQRTKISSGFQFVGLFLLFAFLFNGCALWNMIAGPKGEDFVNTRWVVRTIHGNDVAITGNETWFVISNENGVLSLNGKSECNSIFTSVQVSGEKVTFAEAARTKVMCENIKIEDMFLIALADAVRFETEGKLLRLYSVDNVELLTCEAVFL